jgi:trimeric autotransporter adhesin
LIDTITTKPLTNQVYRWTPFPSITTQAGAPTISKCNNILNQVILGVQVTLPCGTQPVTQFQLNMMGSTAPLTDVTGIHIYYTGNSAAFSPIGEFKAGGTMPDTGTITVTGSQPLVGGTNYFWVAYDISASAPVGNIVQAQCTQ